MVNLWFSTDQPVQIIVANVSGELKAEEGSNVIATCIAAGNNETDFKWIVNDLDITYLSSDSIYRGALVSSQLQLNFTEDSSVASDYVCKETEEFQWNCTRNITCQAIRGNITLDTKDIVITLTGVGEFYVEHEFKLQVGLEFIRTCVGVRVFENLYVWKAILILILIDGLKDNMGY